MKWHTYSCISSEQTGACTLFGRWTNECDPDLEPLVEENNSDIRMEYDLCIILAGRKAREQRGHMSWLCSIIFKALSFAGRVDGGEEKEGEWQELQC